MKRILHVLSALNGGGVETMLWNYYRFMDENEYRFDFIVHEKEKGILEDRFLSKGSQIYRVTPKHSGLFANAREIAAVIREGHYDVVHCHQNYLSAVPLYYAQRYGVPLKIVHAHGLGRDASLKYKFIKDLCMVACKRYADEYAACGADAALWLYGKRFCKKRHITIVPNGIDVDHYRYDVEKRDAVRLGLGYTKEDRVIGTVGRLCAVKNIGFLVDVFAALKKEKKADKLLIVGGGENEAQLRGQCERYGLASDVTITGVTDQVADYLQAMDAFCAPSLSEGFGIAAIEAQANGLPCVLSSNFPREVRISENLIAIEGYDITQWATRIIEKISASRSAVPSQLLNYQIKNNLDNLLTLYGSYIKKDNLTENEDMN